MDRPTIRREADDRAATAGLVDDFLPASRLDLVAYGHSALGSGPVLITGDAGIGKSWLVERWVANSATCRWIRVDLTPDDPPSLLHRQLARCLGLDGPAVTLPTRCDIAEALAERSLNGEQFGLIVDEAHNLGNSLWEEVRVLLNRLGTHDGFAHLILVGQTPLVRRFAARTLGAVESRIAAHLHLRPLDLNDTRAWLTALEPTRSWHDVEVEAIHRDSGGNPARLRRRLNGLRIPVRSRTPGSSPSQSAPAIPSVLTSSPVPTSSVPTQTPLPLTGSPRPPLYVEENSIEVGWSGDEAETADSLLDSGSNLDYVGEEPGGGGVRLDDTDLAVHDHYAALQAWREWTQNQAPRSALKDLPRSDRELADEIDQAAEAEAAEFFGESRSDRGSVRTESHASEPFAPFGALFARKPRGVDAEPTRS